MKTKSGCTHIVLKAYSFVRFRIIFCGVGILTVRKLDLGVIFHLVKKDHSPVRHQTCMHSWYAGFTNDIEETCIRRRGSR